MSISLSSRANAIKPSPTLAISAKSKALKAEGRDIISLSAGEPDFDTPLYIKAAGIDAIHEGLTKYTPVAGTTDLKQAIIKKLNRDNQLEYNQNEVIASSGAKQAIINVMLAILNPGDEVIIPCPYWPSYVDMCALVEAKPVLIETTGTSGFKITAKQLEQAITAKTKLIIINSPSNPSGMLYTYEELKEISQVLLKHPQIVILSDDIYEKIIWPGKEFHSILNVEPKLKSQTAVINGVSKAYAMTGWRIGYAAGPEKLITAMNKIQSQTTSGPCSIAQSAAAEALEHDTIDIKDMINAYYERYQYATQRFADIAEITLSPTDGTFYLFPNITGMLKKLNLKDDMELTEYLLEKANIAVVPGSLFGAPNHLRISIATSKKQISIAIDRIEEMLETV
jgi:aspartate aminotransferase